MKKVIVGVAIVIAAIASLHRFAPALHVGAMKKCGGGAVVAAAQGR